MAFDGRNWRGEAAIRGFDLVFPVYPNRITISATAFKKAPSKIAGLVNDALEHAFAKKVPVFA